MEVGEKHHKLTCVGKDTMRDYRYYLFQCECGNVKSIISDNVKAGKTKSCGCTRGIGNTKHGHHGTRLYNIWKSIRERCNNPNTNRHKIYHDRGISICAEWNDYVNFYKWAIENGYSDNLTIDRIDVNGNYEPSNCRWVTMKVQANNKTNNHTITLNDVTHTIAEWSDITGISQQTILCRIQNGWSAERTLSEKPFVGKNQYV